MYRVVFIDGIVSVSIIKSWDSDLWGIRRGDQNNNRVLRGKRDGIWKKIRGISGSFIQAGTIINGNKREIQIWDTKTSWKWITESVINRHVTILSRCNFLVLAFL